MKDPDRNYDFNVPKQDKPVLILLSVLAFALAVWGLHSLGLSDGNTGFAFVGVIAMGMSVWYFRDLWHRTWFWLVIFSLCMLHIALLILLPLPQIFTPGSAGRGALVCVLFDMFFIYCCIRVAERTSQGWPKNIEVPCRVCGADVDRHAVQCPHCGAWSPAPPSQWIILIALAPSFLFMLFVLLFVGNKHLGGGH